MKPKSNKFSVHYDRIVDYGFPLANHKLCQTTSPNSLKGKKAIVSKTTIFAMILLAIITLFGTIWFFTQKGTDKAENVREKIILQNVATGQIMGRP